MKRTATAPDTEPDQKDFKIPSEKEHLFQVVDVFDNNYEQNKFNLDNDTVLAKCEIIGGDEEGRTLLNRLNVDFNWKGFFSTRMFLKSIGEQYKGKDFLIDTDNWIGRQFYATVVHTQGKNGKVFANIKEYNFDKLVEQHLGLKGKVSTSEEIAWDDEVATADDNHTKRIRND